jgi:hypothetical protein
MIPEIPGMVHVFFNQGIRTYLQIVGLTTL